MYGYIYKTTNTLTNRIYVGKKTSTTFLKEQYLGSGVILNQAINKYGRDNFVVEMIDTADTLEELNNKEKYWIAKLDATNPSIGYNIAPGGDGGIVWGSPENHPSKHTNRFGERNPFYHKHHTQETKDKIRAVWKEKMNEGYTASNTGKIRIHKEDEIKYINPEELSLYQGMGWTHWELPKPQYPEGGWHQSDYQKQRASEVHRNKVITKEQIEKTRITMSNKTEEEKLLMHQRRVESHKKICWVKNSNGESKQIHKEELQQYLDKGWMRGRYWSRKS